MFIIVIPQCIFTPGLWRVGWKEPVFFKEASEVTPSDLSGELQTEPPRATSIFSFLTQKPMDPASWGHPFSPQSLTPEVSLSPESVPEGLSVP